MRRQDGQVMLPDTGAVALALLKLLQGYGRGVKPKEVYGQLADVFQLTGAQRTAKRRTTSGSAWHNRVQTAREHLVRQGLLDGSQRGVWRLTPKGVEAPTLKSTDM